ncbi:uncharacterized protein LOC131816330 isoform X5 [Mustela lutreola]|uniref:uncharacterized protein LOC131816330 isoform X5 n=1 Tax=Mustela lutreola TaxID=9666 RepID=UPI002797B527|nr:uncharacterized protein LOC131816330 isoform X5 [Mustela lutreola]
MGTFEGPSGSTLRTAWPLLPLRCGMMAQDFWKLQKLLFLNGGPKVSCDLVSRAACAPNPGVLFFLFVLPLRLAPPPPATGYRPKSQMVVLRPASFPLPRLSPKGCHLPSDLLMLLRTSCEWNHPASVILCLAYIT